MGKGGNFFLGKGQERRTSSAEGWTAVAAGQTQLLSKAKKRRAEQTCELRHSPTRL
ncbi:hypothetical protein SGRA_1662 [Saprospira grandis str. Lewin]|uniref:Uncharacterized protein n=1 Tax=Saprospira grandis (strain Lewin) TaxID=984262 RepID=H6LAB2_SAPGL|nr:hypothetical protein SGRA_1662 [Saprospira grandis str. Lewin]